MSNASTLRVSLAAMEYFWWEAILENIAPGAVRCLLVAEMKWWLTQAAVCQVVLKKEKEITRKFTPESDNGVPYVNSAKL